MRALKVFARGIVSDLRHTFGRGVLVVMVAVGAGLLGFLFVIGNLIYPYHPVTVYEYRAVPMEVCPGEDVSVEIDWGIRDDVRVLEAEYRWGERGSPAVLFSGQGSFENIPATGRETRRSPLIRTAPTKPGMWRLEASYNVFGMRLGLPVRQDINNVSSEDFVRVLEADDKKCEGSR